jgi:hypothetical protein
MLHILALLTGAAGAQPAGWVVYNARVYTMNAASPVASAITIRGNRIAAVGDECKSCARRVDAKGAAILPGLIDSHGHMAGLGESLESLDLRKAASAADAARAVADAAARQPKGEWIRGRGWDQTRWPGAQFPTAEDLAKAAPDHPVYLTRVDGHAAWVNRRALDLADVNAATKDPAGGRILRDAGGRPTGVLVDRAMSLVASKIPTATEEQVLRRIRRAAQHCASLGLTSVHDAGVTAQHIAAYRKLIAAGELPVRIYAMIGGAGSLWERYLRRGPETGEFLTVHSIKLMADGALGSRGAAMKEPYSDEPSNRGLLILDRAGIERVARQAVAHGFQVNTHAIGDRANREVLDAYGAALGGANGHRFRIEHAQIVSLDDFSLFQRHSVIASMQARHATSDMRWAGQRIGPDRLLGAYAWQRMAKAGVVVANGSDFPVEPADPLLGFYASITRQDEAGSPAGGWTPDQRMTREQALRSFTLDAAYAAFEEKEKGSLEPGKLADFIMLSHDVMRVPAADILKTKVTMTVVNGRIAR